MASHLERELSSLKQELVGLGTMVENSVRKVILAKEKNDQDLAKSIILKDKEIPFFSDAEIEGAFEMVTEHLFPYSADEMEKIMALLEAREEPEAGV